MSRKIMQFLSPLSPSLSQCYKICMPAPYVTSGFSYSQLWLTKKGQSNDIRLGRFEATIEWCYQKTPTVRYKINIRYSIANGF